VLDLFESKVNYLYSLPLIYYEETLGMQASLMFPQKYSRQSCEKTLPVAFTLLPYLQLLLLMSDIAINNLGFT